MKPLSFRNSRYFLKRKRKKKDPKPASHFCVDYHAKVIHCLACGKIGFLKLQDPKAEENHIFIKKFKEKHSDCFSSTLQERSDDDEM